MIEVNGHYISAEIEDIIIELKQQLELNGVKKFYKIIDTPNNTMICCPFHKNGQERKPSMGIYKKDGTCHCFSCGWVGSIQEMISNCLGYDDMGLYGGKWLVRNFLSLKVEERKDIELDLVRDNTRNNDNNSTFVDAEELDKYRWYHPYWKKRGITDEYIIELFDLGADLDNNMITFPCRDKYGNCLFVAKRSVLTKFFTYPSDKHKDVYGIYELYKLKEFPKEVWITESMIDALRLWQVGKYACALNGLGTALQFKHLQEMPCRLFILATDMDNAGQNARIRIKTNIKNKLFKEVYLPENRKDIGDCTDLEILNLQPIFC